MGTYINSMLCRQIHKLGYNLISKTEENLPNDNISFIDAMEWFAEYYLLKGCVKISYASQARTYYRAIVYDEYGVLYKESKEVENLKEAYSKLISMLIVSSRNKRITFFHRLLTIVKNDKGYVNVYNTLNYMRSKLYALAKGKSASEETLSIAANEMLELSTDYGDTAMFDLSIVKFFINNYKPINIDLKIKELTLTLLGKNLKHYQILSAIKSEYSNVSAEHINNIIKENAKTN